MCLKENDIQEFGLEIDLSDEFKTEITVFNFLLILGFRLQMRGTKYLIYY